MGFSDIRTKASFRDIIFNTPHLRNLIKITYFCIPQDQSHRVIGLVLYGTNREVSTNMIY